MTEFSTSLVEPEAPEISTQLDAPRVSDETLDAKAPPSEDKPSAPVKESRLDAIKRAADDVKPKDVPETAEKPVKEPAKDEAATDKNAADEGEEGKAEKVRDPTLSRHGKPISQAELDRRARIAEEAPAKFLPAAKEYWGSTPKEVRSEFNRLISEAESETHQARESVKEFESVRPYAEMARRSGTTLEAALGAFTRLENTLRDNPTEGLRSLLSNMGMNPVQAIGHILAAHNVRPEQLAAHIASSPNEYTALARSQPQQMAPQADPRVQSLEQQIQQMQQAMQHQTIERDIISPFVEEHPRYHELETVIASFLQSDMVPQSLSPSDRLAAAYDLAVRISPRMSSQPEFAEAVQTKGESRAGDDFGGTKSVRGAPASGVETTNPRKGKLSRGDALKSAMAELGLAN